MLETEHLLERIAARLENGSPKQARVGGKGGGVYPKVRRGMGIGEARLARESSAQLTTATEPTAEHTTDPGRDAQKKTWRVNMTDQESSCDSCVDLARMLHPERDWTIPPATDRQQHLHKKKHTHTHTTHHDRTTDTNPAAIAYHSTTQLWLTRFPQVPDVTRKPI